MELLLPVFIIIFASLFQGTFGLGMKYIKPMAWEAWWLVHATVAMVIFPLIWGFMVVPDLCQVISNAPANELVTASLLGFLWGIGGIMFGVSVGYIGMSLTYGIVMGLCSIAGALIPLFIRFDSVNPASLPFIFGGLGLLAIAVVIITVAGLKRDKLLAEVVCGGNAIDGDGYFMEPTILANVSIKMDVAAKEIFGPVLPIIKYTDTDDEIALANDTEYGLAAYVFTTNLSNGLRAAKGIQAGSVCINEPHYSVQLPHGGLKQSGVGKDCSRYSIAEYLTLKRVSILL